MSEIDESDIDVLGRLHAGEELEADHHLRLLDTDSDDNTVVGFIIYGVFPAIMSYSIPYYGKEQYHTSALSGIAWVEELMEGHPGRIRCELGVHLHIFKRLLSILQKLEYKDSRHVPLHERLVIFLYTCITGLTTCHVGEYFQWSNSTISHYFKKMLVCFSSHPFYTKYIWLPQRNDPIPLEIANNPKHSPFFNNALGAVDGTHIACAPSGEEKDGSRNRKGTLSQNCLMACSFDLRFLYICSGWEGSAADALVYHDA